MLKVMKNIIFILCCMCCCCNFAQSQSRTAETKVAPRVIQQKKGVAPVRSSSFLWRHGDTLMYNNKIFRAGIRNAEYQNRGSEDRRNINSNDPNAIQNRKVPEQQRAEPIK